MYVVHQFIAKNGQKFPKYRIAPSIEGGKNQRFQSDSVLPCVRFHLNFFPSAKKEREGQALQKREREEEKVGGKERKREKDNSRYDEVN